MCDQESLAVTRTRHYSAHHMLLGAARMALEDAKGQKSGQFYSQLVAISMSALAIESLCNAVGERIVEDWNDFEKASPQVKIRLICIKLEIDYEWNKEPWSSLIWLGKLRNKIAHAKPQLLSEEYSFTRDEYDQKRGLKPESALERAITLENAERAYRQVTKMKEVLCSAVPTDDAFGLSADSWTGRSST